jgi:tRNA(fMet)-specific endonuclease VapC
MVTGVNQFSEISLDTNIAIEVLNANSSVKNYFVGVSKIYLPVTVVGELLWGAKNSSKAEENLVKYKNFISGCEVLNVTSQVADVYSSVKTHLKKIGKPIPENDIWIAAICIANNVALITKDADFNNIPELQKIS